MKNFTLEDELVLDFCSPFTKRTQEASLPYKFKMSTIASYEGTTNLVIHIINYNIVIKIACAETDEAKCLAFTITLTNKVATWFTKIKQEQY